MDTTIVLTTHDLAEAERLCDDITVIDGGRVVASDAPAGLVSSATARLGRPGDAVGRVHGVRGPFA